MDLTRSSLKIFCIDVIATGLGFLGIAFFSRKLGASTMGSFFLFQALLGMLSVPADFGLRGAAEKRISEKENNQGSYLSSALILKIIPMSLLATVLILFHGIVNNYLGAHLAYFLVIGLILQEGSMLSIMVLNGELRVGETAILRLIRQGAWVIIGYAFVYIGIEILGLVIGLLSGLAIMLIVGWYKVNVEIDKPSLYHLKELVDYSRYNVVSSVGGYFYDWIDIIVIGLFLSQSHVGAYEVAWRISGVVMLSSRSIAEVIFPQVSRWNAEGSTNKIETLINNALAPSLILVIPSLFGAFLLSKDILRFFFGPEFAVAWLVLIILMGEKIIQSIHIILGRALQAMDRPDLAAYATITSIIINIILNIVFVIKWGIVGVASATFISFSINAILHAVFLSKFVNIRIPLYKIGWCIISSAAMALILFIANIFVEINNSYYVIGMVLFGGVLYFGFIYMYPPFRKHIHRVALYI